jgi:hypothetical protein
VHPAHAVAANLAEPCSGPAAQPQSRGEGGCCACANDVPTFVRCGVSDCRCLTFSNRARWLLFMLLGVSGVVLCCIDAGDTSWGSDWLAYALIGVLLLVPAIAIMCTMACCGEQRARGIENGAASTRCAWGPNCHKFGCVGGRTTFGHRSRVITGAALAGATTVCGIVPSVRETHARPVPEEEDTFSWWDMFPYMLTLCLGCGGHVNLAARLL